MLGSQNQPSIFVYDVPNLFHKKQNNTSIVKMFLNRILNLFDKSMNTQAEDFHTNGDI